MNGKVKVISNDLIDTKSFAEILDQMTGRKEPDPTIAQIKLIELNKLLRIYYKCLQKYLNDVSLLLEKNLDFLGYFNDKKNQLLLFCKILEEYCSEAQKIIDEENKIKRQIRFFVFFLF